MELNLREQLVDFREALADLGGLARDRCRESLHVTEGVRGEEFEEAVLDFGKLFLFDPAKDREVLGGGFERGVDIGTARGPAPREFAHGRAHIFFSACGFLRERHQFRVERRGGIARHLVDVGDEQCGCDCAKALLEVGRRFR